MPGPIKAGSSASPPYLRSPEAAQPRNVRAAASDALWLFCFALASSIWCWSAAAALGPTFDEPTYLRCGIEHWQTGSYKPLMRLGTMPLAIDVQTLFVRLFATGGGSSVPLPHALPWARAGTLLFWWALLFYAMRAGLTIGGRWGGRLAVALLASEPVVLGHAALATTDIPVAACLLALAVEFHAGRAGNWPRRLVLPAMLCGLSILAKASALAFAPICLVVIELQRRLWPTTPLPPGGEIASKPPRGRGSLLDIVLIVTGGLLLTFLYCGSDWTTEPTFVQWAKTLPAGRVHDAMLWISEHLRIFTNAGEGLVQQVKHNIRGHGAFILGHEYRRAVWFYFPVALTIKLSLSLLAGVVVLATLARATLRNWASFIALALLAYSLTCRVQIGVRLMLPLIVFLCVGLGSAAAIALRQFSGWKRTVIGFWLVLGISSSAWAAVHVWPHGIAFTNAAWGGTSNGYRLLSDSNYDWGQGLPDLRDWLQRQHEPALEVWYFGSDPSVHEPPLHELPLQSLTDENVADAIRGKLIAVSTTLLYGAYTARSPSASEAAALFRSLTPRDRTLTFFIYDLRQPSRSP